MTRVWVTRDEPEGGPLATAIAQVGLVPVWEPVLETRVVGDAAEELAELCPDDWLVLTSPRAIQAVALGPSRVPRVAVVGAASERLAREREFRVQFVSPTGSGEGVWEAMAELAEGRRVCFPRSSLASVPELAGIEVVAPVLYEPRSRAFDRMVIGRVDVAALVSPSAVRSVAERVGRLPIPAASIGPTTSAAVRGAGGEVFVESPDRSFLSLARSIVAASAR
jgi:uroporphyrinogen-III synthase